MHTHLKFLIQQWKIVYLELFHKLKPAKPSRIYQMQKKKILIWWITRLTATEFLVSPKLMLEMAKKIHWKCMFLVFQILLKSLKLHPIAHNWLTHFKQRNPEISGIRTKYITNFWFKAVTQEVIKPWFDAIAEICLQYCYTFKHCYNMDKSKYAIGISQLFKTLINIREKSN